MNRWRPEARADSVSQDGRSGEGQMERQHFVLKNANETREFGAKLARKLVPGSLVLLSGPLGAGKTTLVQGLARELGINEQVTSPTFVLMTEHHGQIDLLHLDAYRLENADADELTDAGVFDFLARTDAIKLVEWPEMLTGWLPDPTMRVTLALREDGGRDVQWDVLAAGRV